MFASTQLVTDFHAAQSVRALTYERTIQRMADQQPEELAKLLRANPRMLNTLADPEAIAKALADEGQTALCDDIAHSVEVTRDVRIAFKHRGAVDAL